EEEGAAAARARHVLGDDDPGAGGPKLRAVVFAEPLEDLVHAPGSHGDAGVCCAVVETNRVAVLAERVAAREGHVGDVSLTLVRSFGSEDPAVASPKAVLGPLEVQKRYAQAVQTSRGRVPDAVIDHQPTGRRLDQRRRETNLVRIPPGALACRQDELVVSPVAEVR